MTHDRAEFFAGLSHELRTPLAVILTQAHLVQKSARGNEALVKTGKAIDESAAQLLDTVNSILELAQAEQSQLAPALEPVRLQKVVDSLLPIVEGLGHGAGVKTAVKVPRRLLPVNADPARLREILLNLIDNAVKYTPSGGSVELTAIADGDYVRVVISDTGVGVPPDVAGRIFEPFFRASATAPQHGESASGLGLALTRRWVDAHGGCLAYEPRRGGGSVFTFTLPFASATTGV